MTERYVTLFCEQSGRRGRKQLLHERSDVGNELRGFRDVSGACTCVHTYALARPRVLVSIDKTRQLEKPRGHKGDWTRMRGGTHVNPIGVLISIH